MAPELPVELARWLRQRTTPSLIAHLVAWAGHDGWFENRCLRLLEVVSALNNRPLDRVITSTHRTAVVVSRRLEQYGGVIFSPGEQLFWARRPPRGPIDKALVPTSQSQPEPPRRKPAAAVEPAPAVGPRTAPPAQPVEPSAPRPGPAEPGPATTNPAMVRDSSQPPPPAGHTDPALLHAFVTRCRDNAFVDLRQLMMEAGITLEKGLGLRRSLFFLRPGNSDQLRCYLKHGFAGAIQGVSLDVPVSPENLLTRLVGQGGSIRVDAEHGAVAIRQLPACLHELATPAGFVVTSIKLNERPIGAIWADSGSPSIEVHAKQYDVLRVVAGHFNTAFTHLTRTIKK